MRKRLFSTIMIFITLHVIFACNQKSNSNSPPQKNLEFQNKIIEGYYVSDLLEVRDKTAILGNLKKIEKVKINRINFNEKYIISGSPEFISKVWTTLSSENMRGATPFVNPKINFRSDHFKPTNIEAYYIKNNDIEREIKNEISRLEITRLNFSITIAKSNDKYKISLNNKIIGYNEQGIKKLKKFLRTAHEKSKISINDQTDGKNKISKSIKNWITDRFN